MKKLVSAIQLKAVLSTVFWLLLFVPAVYAATSPTFSLSQWRQQVTKTRWLADNDPAKAYKQAQSLRINLPAAATSADQVQVLNLLARSEIYLAKTEISAKHAYQALALAKQHHDRIGQVAAKINIAMIEIHRGNISASAKAVRDGVELLNGVDRPNLLAELMLRLSMSYLRLNLVDQSVTLALQNMEIAKQSDSPFALMYADQGLGIVNEQTGHYQAAHRYFLNMYHEALKGRVKRWQGQALLGIGATAQHLGKIDIAEQKFQQAITLFRQAGFPFNLAPALYNYAALLNGQKRYAEAKHVLREVISIYQRYHNRIGLWFTLNAYSKTLRLLNDKSSAEETVKKAYQLAKDIGFPRYIENSAQQMAKISVQQRRYKLAYRYVAEATTMANRYARKKASDRIVQLTEQYKEESKQRRINKLNLQAERQAAKLAQQRLQQKLLWTILTASLLMLIASGGFALRLRRSNRQLKVLNRKAQHSQSKLQATVEAIPDLLFVLDSDGTYLEFHTPKLNHLLYAPMEQALGKVVSDVLPENAAKICMTAIAEARVNSVSAGQELMLSLADGNSYWFELSVASKNVMPGDIPKFIVLSRDITERKKMEQALLASEQQFRALVENSPDGVVRYDRDGRRIYLNPTMQQTLGMPANRVLGKSINEWVLPQFEQEYKRQFYQVIDTGTEGRLNMHNITADGKNLYSDVRFVPEFDENGEVMSVLAVGRDITLLKEAEQKVEEAFTQIRELAIRRDEALEEERKRIARDMHDELGQYLTTLRMKISMMRMQSSVDNKDMDKRLQAMTQLLDKTLQVVRQIASRLRPAQLEMGVIAALEWLVDDFTKMTGVGCELYVDCNDAKVSDSQATVIFRIAQESLTNVIRYAKASNINISLWDETDGYHLHIEDDGIGFDPTQIQTGTFGLLGMKERVTSLNGCIDIESEREMGTVIKVFFPKNKNKQVS